MLPDPLPPGTNLSGFRVVRLLGRGGMGAVYEGRDERLGRGVAIKLLANELCADARARARFEREARAAASIAHPNVVTTILIGEEKGVPFIVLELMTGGSLEARVKAGRLPWREAAAIGAQVARALEAIHERGLVHRDLKPANVLFATPTLVKVSDFGLVATDADRGALTRTGEVLGTAEYMPPEQVDSARAVDGKADVYALGATLFHALAGRRPFEGQGYALLRQVLTDRAPPVRSFAPDVPAKLERLVADALEKEPAARPAVATVAARLEELARADEPTRRSLRPVAAALVLLALVAAGTAWASRHPPSPAPVTGEGAPAWYLALPERERPGLPLPPGLGFGVAPGEYVNARDGSVLVFVPAGEFDMGLARADLVREEGLVRAATPVHRVTLSEYFIGKVEVTHARFTRFCRESGYRRSLEVDREWRKGKRATDETHGPTTGDVEARLEHPVTLVSWEDAAAYCRWAGLRLPSEAQWERAASWDPATRRARTYPWGDEPPDPGTGAAEDLADVGSFPRDASPCGALDMAGNASEWVEDQTELASYRGEPERDPRVRGEWNWKRALRGAGIRDRRVLQTRDAARPDVRSASLGFRVALSPREGPFDPPLAAGTSPHPVALDWLGRRHEAFATCHARARGPRVPSDVGGGGSRVHSWIRLVQDFVGPDGPARIMEGPDGNAFWVEGEFHRVYAVGCGSPLGDADGSEQHFEHGRIVIDPATGRGRFVPRR